MKEIQSNGKVSELLRDVSIPKMFHARQTFPREMIRPEDIPAVVNREMGQEQFSSLIKPGMEIAITAGSRGIRNVDIITKAIVDFVKAKGAHPFIVPAMGSHGGATAEGQLEILSGYNITPETMGCPIKSSMEVVELGVSERGRTVYLDKNAYEADGVSWVVGAWTGMYADTYTWPIEGADWYVPEHYHYVFNREMLDFWKNINK